MPQYQSIWHVTGLVVWPSLNVIVTFVGSV